MPQMTEQQAYAAMFVFLEGIYQRTGGTADLGGLLGSMATLPDGRPADPAFEQDWRRAVRTALEGRSETGQSLR